MAKYRKKPVVIEATQWFKNGDHPNDNSKKLVSGFFSEGEVVRRWRHPNKTGDILCRQCHIAMNMHGWVDTLESGHTVCPGDWIITGVKGENYPIKDSIFKETYNMEEKNRPFTSDN